jgi:hypothetical protein
MSSRLNLMHLMLEFSDSEVGRVERVGDQLRIHFSAAAVLQVDVAAPSDRAGYARAVELVLFGAAVTPPAAEPMGRIAEGRLALAERWLTRLPLPHQAMLPVRLELRFAQHGEMSVVGSGVECRFADGPNFTESLSC